MDLNDLRQIINREGGKIIIIEDGKPILVISSFEEYKKRPNFAKDTQNENMMTEARFTSNLPRELEEEPLKIEDLPI